MKYHAFPLCAATALLAALVTTPVEAVAQGAQGQSAMSHGARAADNARPNHTCRTAKNIGSAPTFIEGMFEALEGNRQDIHFYAFEAEPGKVMSAWLVNDPGADVLVHGKLLVGLFDSKCRALAWNDHPDRVEGDEADYAAYLRFRVPDDGRFILAATSAEDRAFAGKLDRDLQEAVTGTYLLHVRDVTSPSRFESPNYFITGRVVDRVTGDGLSGYHPPYARVTVRSCAYISLVIRTALNQHCYPKVATVVPDREGRFEVVGWEFTDHPFGESDELGWFLINAWAVRYEADAWLFRAEAGGEVTGVIELDRQVNRPGR
jgi:hypothetical protein